MSKYREDDETTITFDHKRNTVVIFTTREGVANRISSRSKVERPVKLNGGYQFVFDIDYCMDADKIVRIQG